MKGIMMICSLLFSLNAAAQGQDSISSGQVERTTHTLMSRLYQAEQYLDSAAKKKVDPHYIEVPDKPWRIILRYKENGVNVDYSQGIDFPAENEHSDWNLHFEPPMASSIGFWVGYRGTGISYSKSLTQNAGRYFSFSSTGAKYGFNFRLRRFNTNTAVFSAKDYKNGKLVDEFQKDEDMPSPVWIRSVYANGYYVFNGRRYSQAAAYNQSVIQRHSSGSLLLGATWFQSSFDYSDMQNAIFMLIGHGIHRIKVHQANIGIGYGYNFVPLRGLVINVMAMSTISVYNRVKAYKYDFNYELTSSEEQIDDYGQWNPQTKTWANGKKYKPITMLTDDNNTVVYWNIDPETNYSMLRLNIDLRLGIAYNWSNFFIGLQAQYNNFSYKKDQCKVTLFDGYARVAMGMRL